MIPFYSLCYFLILPFLLLRLFGRGRRMPAYRARWRERLGYYARPPLTTSIWVHAVSYGEAVAAEALIETLLTYHPESPVVVTAMTPTGSARLQKTFGERIVHCYIPYDYPAAVRRFLAFSNPRLAILMETELWPNLLQQLKVREIPSVIANARLSPRSFRRYQWISCVTQVMLKNVTVVLAQTAQDAERFIALGLPQERVSVTGSLKWDNAPPAAVQQQGEALRAAIGKQRPVWIAASTHPGEELQILLAHQQLLQQFPNLLLILAPRHPQRFDEIAQECQKQYVTVRRSQHPVITENTQVLLADTLGELFLLYAAADVAFVGGSLVPIGGHNVLEPAALGKPIITGDYLDNFAEPCALLKAAGGLTVVSTLPALVAALAELFSNTEKCHTQGQRAYETLLANRGATVRQLARIEELLKLSFLLPRGEGGEGKGE